MRRVRQSNTWRFFGAVWRADRPLAAAWWALLSLRGVLPAVFAVVMGVLISAVRAGHDLTAPLTIAGVVFVVLQVLTPVHQSVGLNLGDRTAASLYDRLMEACVRPPGMGHLESPELTDDLTMARDFDLGIVGPSISVSMGFIASGLVELVVGAASLLVLFGFSWWAPPLLAAAWISTHVLLKESGVWRDRNTAEVREAQRHADYAYRLAVDPPAAKEIRLFGLSEWTVERFASRRRRLFDLQWQATRLRERPVIWSLVIVAAANALVFWALAHAASNGSISLGDVVVYTQVAVGASAIAFGGLSWALDGASAPVASLARLEEKVGTVGALATGAGAAGPPRDAAGLPAVELRFRDVRFGYPTSSVPVLDGFDLVIAAGSSLAIVGQNGAGKTTLAKLLCRLYDPQAGAVEVDGADLRDIELDSWRGRVTAVFQDFIRFELPLRDNVAPTGAPDDVIEAALVEAGATGLADLDTPLARGYPGGTDLSGGQWQRIALARALCAVRQGAGVVLLDEPTAQLDVRGEAEIFERILAATRQCTTILISHRFSTVRHADRICVLEHGRVVELGSHDELMALGGRYRTMFDLQASRFWEELEDDVVA